ncbi:MAG: biotin transporter BioY, partial [Ilumatobacter fluminis]
FAVLLEGGTLGAARDVGSQAPYVLLGAVLRDILLRRQGEWAAATGSTAGYLVGFLITRRSAERHLVRRCSFAGD